MGHIIAHVSHRPGRGRKDLAAPAHSRRVLVGIVFLFCIVLIQAAYVYSKVRAIDAAMAAAMAAVRDPVLPNNALTTKRNDERCLLLVVLNGDPQHLFRPATLPVCDF